MAVAQAQNPQQHMLDYNLLPEDWFDPKIEAEVLRLSELALPTDDGVPMESNWHRIEMNLLIDALHAHWRTRTDYFVGGNMFIYYSMEQVRRKHYRGPDFFVVKDVDGTRDRDAWVVWNEDGRYPNVIVELASPSTITADLGLKKDLYANTFRTPEYFCYDPSDCSLWGWRLLIDNGYEEIAPDGQGRLWSAQLNLWLGVWNGEYLRVAANWLRFYTEEGQLVLTLAEAEAQRAEAEAQRAKQAECKAEQEHQRAERLAAQLRALGVMPAEAEL